MVLIELIIKFEQADLEDRYNWYVPIYEIRAPPPSGDGIPVHVTLPITKRGGRRPSGAKENCSLTIGGLSRLKYPAIEAKTRKTNDYLPHFNVLAYS